MAYNGNYDSDFEVRLATLGKLGGDITKHYDSTYEVDLAILDAIQGGGGGGAVIDDNDVSTGKCWSSAKIVAELSGAGFDVEIVEELPEIGDAHTIYFLNAGGSTGDVYDEYMYINGAWERLGTTSVDLSDYATIANVDASLANYATIANVDSSLANYATKNDISTFIDAGDLVPYATIANVDSSLALKANAADLASYATIANVDSSLALKQDKLTAGTNITIDPDTNVISAVGGSSGASIDDNDVSTNTTWSSNKITTVLNDYATIANVDSSLALKANASDLANYATIANVDSSLANYATIANVDASLANYATIANVDSSLAGKQDVLTAGTNITIQNNVISATGGGGGASIVELTQAQYDALSTASKTDGTLYSITDATVANMNDYYTKTEANAAFNPIATVSQSTSGYKFPTWNVHGQINGTSATAYQATQNINGSSRTIYSTSNSAMSTIYAPTSAGTSGYYLVSSGSGAPTWKALEVASDYVIDDADAYAGNYSTAISNFYTKTIAENTIQGVQIKITDSQTIYEVGSTTLSTLSNGDAFAITTGGSATLSIDVTDGNNNYSVLIGADGTITDADNTGCVSRILYNVTSGYYGYTFNGTTYSFSTFGAGSPDVYGVTTSSASFDSYYLPSSGRIYNGMVELWLFSTENGATWENRHYLMTSNTVTLDVTTGTFGQA